MLRLRVTLRSTARSVGQAVFDLPIDKQALPFANLRIAVESQAFGPFRRVGQRILCQWYWLHDAKF